MSVMITLLLASFAITAFSACDNQCSGHGTCMLDDICNCYDNWGVGLSKDSGDCSDMICPFELAWVDTPSKKGTFHKYVECAGRGVCDRTTGECNCFDGYEGKACARSTCPNDCSGHGTCEYIEDLGYAASWNDYTPMGFNVDRKTFKYTGWDKHKIRGCVCDALWGDVDCSKKMCPYGTDVLDTRDDLLISAKYQTQNLIFISGTANIGTYAELEETMGSKTFALTFKSKLNETFTTIPIVMKVSDGEDATITSGNTANLNDLAHDVQLALLSLPNKVIDGITVAANSEYTTDGTISGNRVYINVTFTGDAVQGPQYLLSVVDYECYDGCTPKITGIDLWARPGGTSNITEVQSADFNSYECGRRGKCDYSTGLCSCYTGYTGDNCNTLSTLV